MRGPLRADPSRPLPGDDVIPDAGLVFDRAASFASTSEDIWPWIVQLGKRRAGWYMPARIERWIVWSKDRRATTRIDGRWQHLETGDRVPDYGGKNEWFEVVSVDPPHALVYRSDRRAGSFSWALVLTPVDGGRTLLHARFRGTLISTGLKRRVIEVFGDVFDALTVEVMFRGLRERVES